MTSSETTLEWVDAALAADGTTTADPAGREVQELALALRAETPEPDPDFSASLDERVEHGFPRRRRLPRPRALALGGSLAAAAAAAVIAVVASTGGEQHDGVSVLRHEAPASGVAPGAPSALTLQAAPRRVERSAELTLAAAENRLQEVADGAVAVTGRHHGFVEHEDLSTGTVGGGSGSLELRVPVAELDRTLTDLSALARVRARTETADDVTRRYATTSSKLAEARRQRAHYLLRRARAVSAPERERLRQALNLSDVRIHGLASALAKLNRETNFADVQVTLQADRHSGVAGSSTKRALHDAARTFVAVLDFAIRALGALVPLGIVVALGALAARVLRRRRREAALA